ncbi:hypothetical protein JTE79_18885, partial [Escherichia coli]|uniref:hypothetical protein n=1 Tax=Escherichia coli TaxID=562 RepID=UPI0019525F3F
NLRTLEPCVAYPSFFPIKTKRHAFLRLKKYSAKLKNPLTGGFIYCWQHIKLASNIAYFVAFCKPN